MSLGEYSGAHPALPLLLPQPDAFVLPTRGQGAPTGVEVQYRFSTQYSTGVVQYSTV